MASEQGRFYDRNGKAENVGIADARKRLLYPSVTFITKSYRNWGLEKYRDRQMLMAGATTPYLDGENDKDFAKRVLEAADEHREEAANRGTAMHGEIARLIETGVAEPSIDNVVLPTQVAAWIIDNLSVGGDPRPRTSELALIDTFQGYAGTTDYWGMYRNKKGEDVWAIIDFKTQGVKVYEYIEKRTLKSGEVREYLRTRKSVEWYDSWGWQLAGYDSAAMVSPEANRLGAPRAWVSVAINTNPDHPDYVDENYPGLWIKEWKPEVIRYGHEVLAALTKGWYLTNRFPVIGSTERAKAIAARGA